MSTDERFMLDCGIPLPDPQPRNAEQARGGFRKIADLPDICRNPAHNPPGHIVLPRGIYEYVCPGCGQRTVITSSPPML